MAGINGWFGELGRRVFMLVRGEKFDSEMDEEMRLHRELKQRELEVNGVSAEEARVHGAEGNGQLAEM